MNSGNKLHYTMIHIAVAGVCFGGLGYFMAPVSKQAFFERLAEWSMVFLFGKFTNGFGGRQYQSDEVNGTNRAYARQPERD